MLKQLINEIIDGADHAISDIMPSTWAEQNRNMTGDTRMKGQFSFKNSPYVREIVDNLSPTVPSNIIAIEKGAQIGLSTGLIENGIAWIIKEAPANILFLVGHEDLVKDAGNKVDRLINDTGIRHLIKSSAARSRNVKSGDTDNRKDFAGGYLKMGVANHKALRNISMKYGFIDDFESMRSDSKQSGSTAELVEQRFASFGDSMKLFYISTPEKKEGSNIHGVYLKGDQRKYHIPCPCCNELIVIYWEVQSELHDQKKAGITWQLDEAGELIEESVGYICQKCDEFFTDENKSQWLLEEGFGGRAKWLPTAKASEPGYVSYQISALYAPTYMFGWIKYVRKYLAINPLGGTRDEKAWQTFQNVVLGEPYEPSNESNKASDLQRNIRPYEVGSIPEKLSIADGNGKIVLLTMAADMNGTEDDARIDYEITAWSENEVTYSVTHGSIGTFINRDTGRIDRQKWNYRRNSSFSVWPELDKIIKQVYVTDTGRKTMITLSGLDTGYLSEYSYPYIDASNGLVVGLKGDKVEKYSAIGADKRSFKVAQERPNLFIVNGNLIKDQISALMKLTYDPNYNEAQPSGFMNFPLPSGGKYLLTNFFEHFEAESKVFDEKQKAFVWKKKSSTHQNHLWDCRVYNHVVKDVILFRIFKELKVQNGTWKDFCDLILGRKKSF